MKKLLCPKTYGCADFGLLVLRVSVGLMMAFSHGLGKVQKFFAGGEIKFPDPIGIGASASLFMAGFTEFFLSLLLVVGLATRLVTIPLAFTMIVAAFIVHGADPFAKKEFALLYLFPYIALFFTGPGKYSLDSVFCKKDKNMFR